MGSFPHRPRRRGRSKTESLKYDSWRPWQLEFMVRDRTTERGRAPRQNERTGSSPMHPVEQRPKECGTADSHENGDKQDPSAMTPIAPAHPRQEVIPVIALTFAQSRHDRLLARVSHRVLTAAKPKTPKREPKRAGPAVSQSFTESDIRALAKPCPKREPGAFCRS